jgi:predicted nuclease of predicted toxin-antitoxin system
LPIRFYLDEHISARIAAGLRRRNIDVTTAADAGLAGADDAAQLEFAASSGRVLVIARFGPGTPGSHTAPL